MSRSRTLQFLRSITERTDTAVSFLILATIFVLIFFAAHELVSLFLRLGEVAIEDVLLTMALTVVIVKAYRLLVFYMNCHHVSVKYIVEISIIAPAVELIFAPGNRSLEINILFAAFSVAMLVVYMLFSSRLESIDQRFLINEQKKRGIEE